MGVHYMKIKDLMADWLSDTELFEMAYQRKKAMEIVSIHQDQIATHLVKHLSYDIPVETKKHWEAEINAWIAKIDKIKLKNGKKLSGDVYYNLLFNEPLGEISDLKGIIKTVNKFDGMDAYNVTNNLNQVHETVEKILHALSYDLSNDKVERIQHYIELYT